MHCFIVRIVQGTTWTLPLRAYHRVGKTDIKSVKQSVIPNVQHAAGRVQGGVGRFHTGLEGQVIIPDATQSVSGKAKASF